MYHDTGCAINCVLPSYLVYISKYNRDIPS